MRLTKEGAKKFLANEINADEDMFIDLVAFDQGPKKYAFYIFGLVKETHIKNWGVLVSQDKARVFDGDDAVDNSWVEDHLLSKEAKSND